MGKGVAGGREKERFVAEGDLDSRGAV